jgi:SAM-dependent methyltransferase
MSTFFRPPTHLLRDRCIEAVVRDWSGAAFLEIGPGSGRMTQFFLSKFNRGACCDISDESRRILREKLSTYSDRLDIVESLSGFRDGSFEYLFSLDVIEHIENDGESFREWSRCLRSGGRALISVPAHRKAFGTSDEMMGHFRRYEKEEVQQLFDQAGYQDIVVLNYGFPLLNLSLKTINALYALNNRSKEKLTDLTLDERTRMSGISNPDIVRRFAFLFDDFTIMPFAFLQKFFFKKDWGVAYVAYATKC